ncbi:unnamed protein product [Calypogeia fissa]
MHTTSITNSAGHFSKIVGFGVSTPEQAAKLAKWGADGVIIGSIVVKLLGESGSPETGLKAVKEFAVEVWAALAPTNCLMLGNRFLS